MNTLYSYLKAIEQKLSAPEDPEIQFLNLDIYKNPSFNLKSLSLTIFEKIKDTTYLLNQLKLTTEKTKNEIFDQINSNYNNYVTLISKLQTIDFLVDNIQKSFEKIKNKIDGKLNLVERYEKEFTEMLNYIKENDNEIIKIQKAIKEYETNIKASKIKDKIDKFIINNSLNINERQYTPIRQLMFLFISYFELVKLDEKKYFNYFSLIDDILYHFTENYFIKQNNSEINLKLDLNIIKLIFKIYKNIGQEDIFYQKLFNGFIKSNLNKLTDSSKDIPNIINDLINYINSPQIQNLIIIFSNNNNFLKICFLNPFINKYIKEKFLFNCSDLKQFYYNYKNILKFLKLFDLQNPEDINLIHNFVQNFSFFTYYQYLQNDLSSSLTGLIKYQNSNINEEYIKIITSSIYNYLQAIKDIFKEQKIFIKILPNFLTFISQCSILINGKVNETNKFLDKNKDVNKEIIDNFEKYKDIYNNYFKTEGEFYNNVINNVFENESFLINDEKQKDEFKNILLILLNSLQNL